MSLISEYIEAVNDAIRTGNQEADPVHKESYRAWQEAKAAKDRVVEDLANQIRAQARATGPKERQVLLSDLNCEVSRIGEGCPILTL